MNPLDITRAAMGNTFRSKTRTTLTVTAIVIGAFTLALAITSAIGTGTGISTSIDNQISSVVAGEGRANGYPTTTSAPQRVPMTDPMPTTNSEYQPLILRRRVRVAPSTAKVLSI